MRRCELFIPWGAHDGGDCAFRRRRAGSLGSRATFADFGAIAARYLGLALLGALNAIADATKRPCAPAIA